MPRLPLISKSPTDSSPQYDLGPLAPLIGTWTGEGLDVPPPLDLPPDVPPPQDIPPDTKQHYFQETTYTPIPTVYNQRAGTSHLQPVYPIHFFTSIYPTHKPYQLVHQEVGYWLWLPQQSQVVLQFSIPNGIVIMAGGTAKADDTTLIVEAKQNHPTYGILNSHFLDQYATTTQFTYTLTINDTGQSKTLTYSEISVIKTPLGVSNHKDSATLQCYT